VSAPVFVVPTARLVAGRVVVDGPEGRHAATVTRLTPGEEVVLVDGRGRRGTVRSPR
jgi:16S rRNA (uracil1498-N3)-methyltransferase